MKPNTLQDGRCRAARYACWVSLRLTQATKLDRIATHIISYEGDSKVVFFEGNYTEYEAYKKRSLGHEVQPTRIKYKKLH